MTIATKIVSTDCDLKTLVDEINQASWDDANDLAHYDVRSLVSYLEREDTVFVVCHHISPSGRTLLGFASSRLEIKPYGQQTWLYIDEVDVCTDQRRRGAGTALMNTLIQFARDSGCDEVWLGTEVDNVPANALYTSLEPDEVETFVGYAYELDD